MTAAARDLVQRLRTCQTERHDRTQARDHVAASRALDLAVSLLDHVDVATLREALLHACNPASTPPVPVVLGPQDAAAATVGVDELMALVQVYGQGCHDYARGLGSDRAKAAYTQVRAAVERLAMAAFVVNVDRAHHEGRLS